MTMHPAQSAHPVLDQNLNPNFRTAAFGRPFFVLFALLEFRRLMLRRRRKLTLTSGGGAGVIDRLVYAVLDRVLVAPALSRVKNRPPGDGPTLRPMASFSTGLLWTRSIWWRRSVPATWCDLWTPRKDGRHRRRGLQPRVRQVSRAL